MGPTCIRLPRATTPRFPPLPWGSKEPSTRSSCSGRIMDWEVQQHFKDYPFHGVCKHLRDSIQYPYSNPRITYSQLMIAAHNVESENEEAWDKVGARSTITTKPVKGTTELGNQIARPIAALTRAGQGNSPGSVPNSPRHRGQGRGMDGQEHS